MRHRPVAITQVEFLAGTDTPDVGRVEALIAVDDRQLTDLGQRVDVEESAGSPRSAAGEGFTQAAEEPTTCRCALSRANLGNVAGALFLQLVQQLDVLVVEP